MSRRRNGISGQFAWRLIAMLESPAYRVLSQSAHRILARVEIELAHHGGNDNGKLPLTYEQLEDYGVDRHAIAPALRELVALGFLEITEHGRAGNAEFRRPNLFRLTYRHLGRADPTDEWKRIATIEEAQTIARSARTKSQWGKIPAPSGENPHRKHEFPGGENPHYSHGGESHTTIDISGTPTRMSSKRALRR
jgi:hypothetical protein